MEITEVFGEIDAIREELFRGKAKNFNLGEHPSSLAGVGYDIHDIRQWQRGEPTESIDFVLSLISWPETIYKIEKIELELAPTILVIDVSPSAFVRIDEKSNKLRLLLHLVAALGSTANYFRDPLGVVMFSDKIEFYLWPPKFGSGRVFYTVKKLIDKANDFDRLIREGKYRPKESKTNPNVALEFIAQRVKRQCSIFLLSDFADIIQGGVVLDPRYLNLLSVLHNWNVIAVFLDDPQEFAWRGLGGTVEARDIETGRLNEIKLSSGRKIRKEFSAKRDSVVEEFGDSGVDSIVLSYGDHFNQLAKFLAERKARRR